MDQKIAVAIMALVITASASLYFYQDKTSSVPAWNPAQHSTVALIDTCSYLTEPPVNCVPSPTNFIILKTGFSFSTHKSCHLQIGDSVGYQVSTYFNSQGVNDIRIFDVPSDCQTL